VLHREIDLHYARVSAASEVIEDHDKAFMVETAAKSFICWAKDPAEAQQWVRDLTAAIEALPKK
jgi:hypothetical protein